MPNPILIKIVFVLCHVAMSLTGRKQAGQPGKQTQTGNTQIAEVPAALHTGAKTQASHIPPVFPKTY